MRSVAGSGPRLCPRNLSNKARACQHLLLDEELVWERLLAGGLRGGGHLLERPLLTGPSVVSPVQSQLTTPSVDGIGNLKHAGSLAVEVVSAPQRLAHPLAYAAELQHVGVPQLNFLNPERTEDGLCVVEVVPHAGLHGSEQGPGSRIQEELALFLPLDGHAFCEEGQELSRAIRDDVRVPIQGALREANHESFLKAPEGGAQSFGGGFSLPVNHVRPSIVLAIQAPASCAEAVSLLRAEGAHLGSLHVVHAGFGLLLGEAGKIGVTHLVRDDFCPFVLRQGVPEASQGPIVARGAPLANLRWNVLDIDHVAADVLYQGAFPVAGRQPCKCAYACSSCVGFFFIFAQPGARILEVRLAGLRFPEGFVLLTRRWQFTNACRDERTCHAHVCRACMQRTPW